MKRMKPESNVEALARLKRTEVKEWTVDDVGIWLDLSGLSEHRAEFMKQSVSGAELQDLESEDLTELGMVKMGHKKRFQRRLKLLAHGLDSAFAQSEDGGSSEDSTSFSSSSEKSGASTASAPKRDKVSIKCYCGEDISVLHLSSTITLPRLKSKLKKEYGARMLIKYKDKEGSKVRMKKTTQLTKALKIAADADEPLRLWLYERKKKVSNREQAVLDMMIDAIITINEKGKVLFFNKAAESLWGYSRNEVIKNNVNMLMPDDIAAKHDDYLKAYAKTREARIIGVGRSVVAKHKNGSSMNVHLSVVETKQGANTVFTATVRKDTSASSSSSSEADPKAVFGLLNQLLDACVVINEGGLVQFWNSAAEKRFGFKAAEVVGTNIKFLMPKSEGDRHDSYMQRYMRTNEAHIIGIGRDVVAQRKDGSVLAIHLSVTEQSLGGGKRLFTGIMREVEEELEKAKSVLQQEREVLDGLIVPAIIIDQTGKIHGFNEAASNLLGYSLIDVVSRNVKMLMPPEHAAKHDGYLAEYLKTGNKKIIGIGRSMVAQHKSGALVPIHLSVTEKRDGDKVIFTGILQKKD